MLRDGEINNKKHSKKVLPIALATVLITTSAGLLIANNIKNVETSEVGLLSSQYAENTGVSIHQVGNIKAFAGTYSTSLVSSRSTFSAGEDMKIVVSFDKTIASLENAKLTFSFGSGASKTITGKIGSVNKSIVEFDYTIAAEDVGQLNISSITGKVTDNEGYDTQITLTGSIDYQNISQIVVDNTIPTYSITKTTNSVTITFNEEVFNLNGTVIEELTAEEIRNALIIVDGSKSYKLKGETTLTVNTTINPTTRGVKKIELSYITPANGDNGTIKIDGLSIVDIAGNNINDAIDTTYTIATNKVTPYVTGTSVYGGTPTNETREYLDENNDKQTNPYIIENVINHTTEDAFHNVNTEPDGTAGTYNVYKAGKKIFVNLTLDELAYLDANKTKFSQAPDRIPSIKVHFSSSDEKNMQVMEAYTAADGKAFVVSYVYTIADGDSGNVSIVVPEGIFFDDTGRSNEAYTYSEANVKITTDMKAPSVTEITKSAGKIYKTGETITFTLNTDEAVDNNDVVVKFSESDETTAITGTGSEFATARTYTYTIDSEDKGYLTLVTNFKDAAGNTKTENLESKNYWVDREGPVVSISSETTNTNSNTVEYTVSVTDNSSSFVDDDGNAISNAGVASNTLTDDDFVLINARKDRTTANTAGNVTNLKVVVERDGQVKVGVTSGKVADKAGNTNTQEEFNTQVLIDTVSPMITNITKDPTGWTNEKVTVQVTASDSGSGVAAYSFDGGETWQASGKIELTENKVLGIQVKDKAGNINSYGEVEIDNIDNKAPVVKADKNYIESENKVEYTFTLTDAGSGVDKFIINEQEITLTNGSATVTFPNNGTYTVTATDKVGNVLTMELTVDDIRPADLQLDESIKTKTIGTNNYIILDGETTTSQLLSKVTSDGEIKVITGTTENTSSVKTGDYLTLNGDIKYIIVVKGDVTKDGKVDISDIFEMNKMRLGYKTGDVIQRLAGDVVESDKVDMDDIFQVNKYRLKMINSL